MKVTKRLLVLGLAGVLAFPGLAQPAATARPPLTVDQVVENLVRMNAERAHALRSYQGKRTYRLQYHGFPGSRSAEMVVAVKYESPGKKAFVIESATGSKLVIDRVFKKLLQSESEALEAENVQRTALTPENYIFTLVGQETVEGVSLYVLSVEPRTKSKFLYRGRIWVDANEFAVVRIKAEPAANPSFWTKSTEIEHQYKKVNDFWLPAQNHSVTSVRLGGRADLTIDYQDYQITSASPLGKLQASGPSH